MKPQPIIFAILLGIFSYSAVAQTITPPPANPNLQFFAEDATTPIKNLTFMTGESGESKAVVLKNIGKADFTGNLQDVLQIVDDADSLDKGVFTQTNTCPPGTNATLATGASCLITITFTAKSANVSKASLKLVLPSTGAISIPKEVKLEGQGTSSPPQEETPKLSVTPTALNFDSGKATDTITIKNDGTGTLTVVSKLTGDQASFFQQSGCENASLTATNSCNLTVTFAVPDDEVLHTATMEISSNGGQATVALSGQGKISLPPSTELPNLGQVLAFDTAGNPVNTSTAKFQGGISVNGGTTAQSVEMTLADSVKLTGVITPDSTHNAQTADIIVVGLYVPPEKLGDDNCDAANGDYYMMQTVPDNYCNADKSDCKSSRSKPETSQDYSQIWVKLWDGNLQKLEALYKGVSLAEPIQLTAEGVSKGFGPLYEGQFDAKGHLCINFGYRLSDGTLVFNGKTIDVMIK